MDDPGESLNSNHTLQAGPQGPQNLSTNYNQLLKQIENLSEIQTSGAIQNADPSLQAAYVARLQQQATQIKQLLRVLNSSGGGAINTSNSSNNENAMTKSSSNDASNDANDNNGYESLWEVGLAKNIQDDLIPEVEEPDDDHEVDESQDVNHEDIYENTGVFNQNFTISVDQHHPPPLPPRLPASRPGSVLLADINNSSLTESPRPSENLKTDPQLTSTPGGPSSSFLAAHLHHNTSTPNKEISDKDNGKIRELKSKRAEIISSLQAEERERQWHYSQLELISQKIRNIPLTSHTYSLENELQRQQLEERAARVQSSMLGALGKPEEALARRRARVQAIAGIDTELGALGEKMEGGEPGVAMRGGGRAGGRGGQPQSCNLEQLYHESLPLDKALSHSGPAGYGSVGSSVGLAGPGEDTASVISFTSSVHSVQGDTETRSLAWRNRETAAQGECRVTEAANSLMSLLGCSDVDKMSRTLLAMSGSPANCDMMRSSRCIPLLVQLLHCDPAHPDNPRPARQVRARAARALHNIVHAHPTDKHCKREAKVLKLLEVLRQYCDFLRDVMEASLGSSAGKLAVKTAGCSRLSLQVVEGGEKYAEQDLMVCDFGEVSGVTGGKHVFACHNFLDYSGEARKNNIHINIEETMAILTRCSFDESHRQPIFLLGGIPALAELIQVENKTHTPNGSCTQCREVRRYAVVALTNLTFGNASVKSYLCSFPGFVDIMVHQLECSWENLRKATAHLFRNLAWKADKSAKTILSESQVVTVLMMAAVSTAARSLQDTPAGLSVEPSKEEESTLKVILSALWNLSAHCKKNKSDVCSLEGSLVFLVQLLRSKSTAVVENGGGILRNISSFIATCPQGEQYRKILRDENCLSLLLSQLRSPSLTIVSNACGTLWNFSARSQTDQEVLWELGAVPMLQSLTNSKHKTISTCSLAALKNLYTARPAGLFMMVSGAGQTGQLTARKVKNMVADLDEKLSDCGGKDVEGGTPQDSPDASDNDLECDGEELQDKDVKVRSESQNSASSSQSRSSRSPEGRKVLFLKGMAEVAKQNGTSLESLGKNLPSCYTSPSPLSSTHSPTPPSQGRSSLSAEGRYDSHYKNFMKKSSTSSSGGEFKVPSLELYLDKEKERQERVLSPSSLMLSSAESPSNSPLDLSKKTASTDLTETCEEKPTDYSLRYQESEEPDKEGKPEPLFDDAVRTYYTEGTPMDTPAIFSTATSMNDLREPAIAEEDETEETKLENVDSTMQYAVEGTPLTFSRAESLSDLEEADDTKLAVIPETKEEKAMNETAGEKREEIKTPPVKDIKTVKFIGETGGAAGGQPGQSIQRNPQETPMMFSRASSIASLDSFDQQSTHDEYSSYEASRATSGRVSPSHLPDSPSQTMPSSPGQPGKENKAAKACQPPLAALHKKPVFDDGMRSYQEEGTPAVFSTRTSLSGLEFEEEEIPGESERDKLSNISGLSDDDEDIYADSESLLGQLINSAMPNSKPSKSRLPKPKQAWVRSVPEAAPVTAEEAEAGSDDSTCSADNQDILAQCIASAMPSKTSKTREGREGVRGLGPRQAAEGAPADKKGPVTRVSRPGPAPAPPERKGSHLSHPCVAAAAAAFDDLKLCSGVMTKDQFRARDSFLPDQPRSYKVEDTPLNFSAATSLSDLTVDEPELRSDCRPRARGQARSVPASGTETPLRFMTEDTPAVFSRNDSLSSLECEDSNMSSDILGKGPVQSRASKMSSATVSSPGSFQSHLPRPQAVGRSGSSGSSSGPSERNNKTGGASGGTGPGSDLANKSFNSSLSSLSIESLDNTNPDEEDLLADCISSAMPKSRSEHFDLSAKYKSKPKKSGQTSREKSKSSERDSVGSSGLKVGGVVRSQPEPLRNLEDTLTQSRMSELELASLTPAGLEEAHLLAQSMMADNLTASEYSEASLAEIGPPSIMMDSLPSLSITVNRKESEPAVKEREEPKQLPCRHTLSGKLGSSVPLAVRRALGGSGLGSLSSEDLSSLSSCHSNIDNIAPPSILEDLDMDNSMLSVASISSELAQVLAGSAGSAGSDSVSASEIIRDVATAARAVENFQSEALDSVSHQLESIAAPTIMEDLTLTQDTVTLQPAPAPATYTVENNNEENNDTINDVTECFDEESMVDQVTLTGGSEAVDSADIPELPRDSSNTTPASSLENTPTARRKVSPKERRKSERERYLTFTKSSVQARHEDERFKTRTITREDLEMTSSPEKNSPRSIKQRRSEEAARYLTHTITPADLRQERQEESLTVQEAALLESEARLVVKTITARKAEVKSRSASVEILREHEMTRLEADSVVSSQENLLEDQERIPGKPRICKPWETRVQQQEDSPQKSIRGRRKALYSPPMKRATVPPPVAPKPSAVSRPRTSSSPASTSPRQMPRGTRATQLRQASSSNIKSGSVSGSVSTSPRSISSSSSSMISPRSLTSPHLRTSSNPRQAGARKLSPDVRHQSPPGLVRQGTFTKEDDTTSNSSQSTTRTCLPKPQSREGAKRTPPKTAPKPNLLVRRDVVRPALTAAGTTKTQTLREQSFSRGAVVRSSASSNSSGASRTSIRASSSSHSLRTAAESAPKRIPSSSELERRRPGLSSSPSQQKTNVATVSKPTPATDITVKNPPARKNVTSKIASLWKKAEEMKQKADTEKNSKKYKPKDKRVWISKGKVQGETKQQPAAPTPGQLIRSGTYDKINEMNDSAVVNENQSQSQIELKPRSRSRLSIKLSKFSLRRRTGDGGRGTLEDQYNGNTPVSPTESLQSPSDELGNSVSPLSPNSDGPEIEDEDVATMQPQLRQPNHTFKPPTSRSPASAIVAPFNYNPNQVKRNTSYVSSLGRKKEVEASSGESDVVDQKMTASQTNSAMVTLV